MTDVKVPLLCRDPEDDTKPCPYAGTCHRPRQELHSSLGIRGEDCWFFTRIRVELAYDPPVAKATP